MISGGSVTFTGRYGPTELKRPKMHWHTHKHAHRTPLHTHTHTLTYALTQTHILSHTHTHTLSHKHTASRTNARPLTQKHTLSHNHTPSNAHICNTNRGIFVPTLPPLNITPKTHTFFYTFLLIDFSPFFYFPNWSLWMCSNLLENGQSVQGTLLRAYILNQKVLVRWKT